MRNASRFIYSIYILPQLVTYLRVFVHGCGRCLFNGQYQCASSLFMRWATTYLVTREDQCIGNHDILSSASGKHDDFGNVVRGKWLAVPIIPCQL